MLPKRSFTYDAENRQKAVTINSTITTYTYDGDGRRVLKTIGATATTFVYDAQGHLAAEYGNATNPLTGTTYLTDDHLGSTRLVTNTSGAAVSRFDYAPFGEELTAGIDGRIAPNSTNQYPTATLDGTSQKFTSKERDSETGLDFFGARYMSSAQGRFTSPDEFTGGAVDPFTGQQINQPGPLPYADITDPQSLNKYAYVMNNPLRYTDPDGHCPWCVGAVIGFFGGAAAQAVADFATGEEITLRKELAAGVGGAIIGGTAGAASELGVAVQVAIVGDAGVVGGVAERTINTGSVNRATENPTEIVTDFATSAAGHGVNKAAEAVVGKVAGGAVRELTRQEGRAQTAGRRAKVAERLERAKTTLENKQRAASTATDTARDAAMRSHNQKQNCSESAGCHQ